MSLFSNRVIGNGGRGTTAVATVCLATGLALALPQLSMAVEEGDLPEEVFEPVDEEIRMLEAPEPDERRVYVASQDGFGVINRIFPIDGDTGRLLGMIDAGKLADVNLTRAGDTIVVGQTLYSRIATGDRFDFVAIHDPRTLEVRKEIELPDDTRPLNMTMLSMSGLSLDERFYLYHQWTPRMGVGVVDLDRGEYVNFIAARGCHYVYPYGERRFLMKCTDRSLLDVAYDEQGEAVSERRIEEFRPEDTHFFNISAHDRQGGKLFFVSFDGSAFPVDLGDEAQAGEPWDLLTEEERDAGWAPGGWQVAAYHRDSERLFVLMDQRAPWTHKTASRYVYVYDTQSGERVDEIALGRAVDSLALSQDEEPLLFALAGDTAELHIYDANTGRYKDTVDELGAGPLVVLTADF